MKRYSAYRVSGRCDSILDTIDRLTKSLQASKANTEETLRNRTQATLDKQNAYRKQVSEDNLKIAELEKELDFIYYNLLEILTEEASKMPAKEVLKTNNELLDKFTELNNEYKAMKLKKSAKNKVSQFDNIYFGLCKINPEFILYCDPKVLTTQFREILTKLNKNQLKTLQTRLEEAGMFRPPFVGFMKYALKFFPDYIKIMDAPDQIYALKRDPSAYKVFGDYPPAGFNSNPTILKGIIVANEDILMYLPKKMLDFIAEAYSGVVGNAIMRNPKVLDYFYPEFFRKHSPKYIFYHVSKADAVKTLGDYMNKFPELKEYYNIQEDTMTI